MEKIKLKALTFDDVLLLPRYTDFLPAEADLSTRISRNITLKIPFQLCMESPRLKKKKIKDIVKVIYKKNSIFFIFISCTTCIT